MAKSKKSKSAGSKPVDTTPAEAPSNHAEKDQDQPQSSSQVKPFNMYFSVAADNHQAVSTQSAPSDFESFYLQQVTTEFADDLDKIRNASDFGEKSLSVLVAALKQGTSTYTEEERRKVMGDS